MSARDPLRKGIFSSKSLFSYLMLHSCGVNNFVHACPFVVNDIRNCSPLNDPHDGVVGMHVTIHIDALITVAKVLNVIIW